MAVIVDTRFKFKNTCSNTVINYHLSLRFKLLRNIELYHLTIILIILIAPQKQVGGRRKKISQQKVLERYQACIDFFSCSREPLIEFINRDVLVVAESFAKRN